MRNINDIKTNPRIHITAASKDGFSGDITLPTWRGSVICSTGAGWEHVSVSPYKRRITPSWDDMCRIKDAFWKDDEAVIQIHPPKADYVNNMPNCLHLWRCTYKDTVCDILGKHYVTYVYTSITPIKAAASVLGWGGEKTQKARKFLSDLKDISTAYNNLPFQYMAEKLEEVEEDDVLAIFHIREPREIDKFKWYAINTGYMCKTLLIKSKRAQRDYGNHADDDVELYGYDMIYQNDGRLEDMEGEFMKFWTQEMVALSRTGEEEQCAGMARTGELRPIEIPSEILQRAVENTAKMCVDAVEIAEE